MSKFTSFTQGSFKEKPSVGLLLEANLTKFQNQKILSEKDILIFIKKISAPTRAIMYSLKIIRIFNNKYLI